MVTADGAESAGTAGGSGLAAELDLVGARARSAVGPADLGHLRRLERWGRACTLLGYGTAWLPLNPIAPLFLAMGRFMRWTIVAHPVLHGAYDRVPGVPARLTSRAFARGPRRFLDWLDWLDPSAWRHEHNRLHHTRVGEAADPDDVETNLEWLRQSRLWDPLKLALVSFFALTWKWTYYAPKLLLFGRRSAHEPTPPPPLSSAFLSPELWRRGLLPYASITFLGIPLLFHLALGREAALLVLLHSLIAEALTNLHSFCVIVTNHTGSDLRSFADGPLSKGDFYRRQIAGTVNFKTGGDLNDALHGWLNYQIEHHLFPDLTLLQYRRIQPEVKRLCALHGLAYAQQGVPARLRRTLEVMTGRATARRLERRRGHERPTPAG